MEKKLLVIIVCVYVLLMLRVIGWGLPGFDHPFTYHMDEWHQLQAVRAMFKYGTPNVEGAANGTIFHFVVGGLFLVPFVILGIIDPFAIKSSVGSLLAQQKLFEVLRLNTLVFGLLSIWMLMKISKQVKVNPVISVLFFTITPVWLSLSNYFKYDIALIFWILLAIHRIMEYGKRASLKNYLLAAVPSALAIATKVSAIPMLPIYIFSYFLYTSSWRAEVRKLGFGLLSFVFIFCIFGIGDALIGRGSYYQYFYSNLISTPNTTSNYILGASWWSFLIFQEWPVLFGRFAFWCFVISTGFAIYLVRKTKNKDLILVLVSLFVFALSLIPLKLSATGNRILVLLPFFAIIAAFCLDKLKGKLLWVLIILGVVFQTLESYAWIEPKLKTDQRVVVSEWLLNNIKRKSVIGIENIPIYQMVPDLIIKEFYKVQYNLQADNNFEYLIVDAKTPKFPETVVVTNAEVAMKYFKESEKKDLVKSLKEKGYMEKRFTSLTGFYKYFGDDKTFFLSGLVAAPISISVFTAQTM